MTSIPATDSRRRWLRPVSIAPLVSFRICFGLLMLFSIIRFWWRGWVTAAYVAPKFHFTYWGFGWVQPLDAPGMHLLFVLLSIAALLITLGLLYRVAALVFFIGFTYVELIDVTTYLNHYYFISLVAFLLALLPANRACSLDVYLKPALRTSLVPAWTIGILRFQMAIVYVFAGLAKLNPDWLLEAQPLRTWLPAKTHLPLIGPYLYQTWVAYLFSWFGAFYDLFIVIFLCNRRTRPWAYLFVVLFHGATALFFPAIGMFPYVMIVCSLIFCSGSFHERLLSRAGFRIREADPDTRMPGTASPKLLALFLCSYLAVQLLLPLRYLCYPGHLFWTEEGYRFSWRVMLMEKSGAAYFKVKDNRDGSVAEVNNAAFLTPLQEKMMSTQPDLIVKYAHFLAAEYRRKGVPEPEVYAEVYVSLNGQRSRLFIDSSVNLAAQRLGWKHYNWILPYTK